MNDLLASGVELMLMGMGVVFVFLTLLVFTTSLMSKLVNTYFPEKPPALQGSAATPATSATADTQLMAVITAAVHKYRSRHK